MADQRLLQMKQTARRPERNDLFYGHYPFNNILSCFLDTACLLLANSLSKKRVSQAIRPYDILPWGRIASPEIFLF